MIRSFTLLKVIFVIVYLVYTYDAEAQGIKEFYIECNPEDFDYIYENYLENIFIPVIITYNGTTWTDVELRIRGDSSREYPKKSLKVRFNSDPFVTGESVLNFNAEYHDLSYMHSFLSSVLFEKAGLECPHMEHVRLYLNGNFLGLYLLTENLDEDFLSARNFDSSGNLYKATKDGACLSIYDNVFYHWELKSGDDPYRDELVNLISGLNEVTYDNYHQFLQVAFQYEKLISFLAMNMLLSNGSTYYHNYFLFQDVSGNGQWHFFPWDLDRTFSNYSVYYPYNRSSGLWTPDNPVLERSIIDVNTFLDIKELTGQLSNLFFHEYFLFPIIDSLQNVIANSVMEDTTDNIPDTSIWINNIDEDKQFILERYNHLLNQFNSWPSTFQLDRNPGYYVPGQTIHFSWQPATDPNGDDIFYNFYLSKDQNFEDSATIEITGLIDNFFNFENLSEEGKYYWMVEATDSVRDVPGFDTYNTVYVSSSIANVVINEINYNSSNNFDPGDWVEFYNQEIEPVDISGWYFKDQDNGHIFTFPQGTTIAAFNYLVLCRNTTQFYSFFPATIPTIGNIGFGFNSNGELLRLYHKSGYLVNSLVYRNIFPWPSEPDGNGPTLELINPGLDNSLGYNWTGSIEHGTPGAQNSNYSPDNVEEMLYSKVQSIKIHPNPFQNFFEITLNIGYPCLVHMTIIDVYGRKYIEKSMGEVQLGKQEFTINTKNLSTGIYGCYICIDNSISQTFIMIKE